MCRLIERLGKDMCRLTERLCNDMLHARRTINNLVNGRRRMIYEDISLNVPPLLHIQLHGQISNQDPPPLPSSDLSYTWEMKDSNSGPLCCRWSLVCYPLSHVHLTLLSFLLQFFRFTFFFNISKSKHNIWQLVETGSMDNLKGNI